MTDSPAVTYGSYLGLDELLSAQHPRTEEHDELLFIVIHQVYELWFKQILHELFHLQERLEDGEGSRALATLQRVLAILKTIVAQVDVLETMTPRQFASFRSRLASASGFQSAQFREIEAVLGRRDEAMLRPYAPDSPEHGRIATAMAREPLLASLVAYFAATGFDVSGDPQDVVIAVYAADGEGAQLLERFVDLDEGLQEWRYRHVKMVERTIGSLPGTGGSSGAEYLRSTLFTPFFSDLWAVRSRL